MLLLIITCILMALICGYLAYDTIKIMDDANSALVNLCEEYLKEKANENN